MSLDMRPSNAARINLLTVLSNPATTSGIRTLSRVEAARKVLGFQTVAAENLFALATHSSRDISVAGVDASGWLLARSNLAQSLSIADAVVLAFGCSGPSGPALAHYRAQLDWLRMEILARGLETWMVGARPRHPSRWHRHTSAEYPSLTFQDALPFALQRVEFL